MNEIVRSRTGLLMLAGTGLVALAVAADVGVRVAVPLGVALVTVSWFQTRLHQLRSVRGAQADRDELGRRIGVATHKIDHEVAPDIDWHRRQIERLERTDADTWQRTSFIRRLIDEDRATIERLRADVVSRTWSNTQMMREGLRLLRGEVDELLDRAGIPAELEEHIPVTSATEPVLSIAIPGFNRPDLLAACLESIVAEVERAGTDRVEVWVTDDRSTRRSAIETARRFAQQYPYIGFRMNPTNLGLEHNLIEACRACRGDFVLILGNDDLLHEGALDEILPDIDRGEHDLVVYSKTRIDPHGAVITNPAAGAIPADAESGDRHEYPDVLGFARSTGVLSGYGFISVVLMRRDEFLDVDAAPYLGLTMYPQVGRMLEAFDRSATMFRNVPVVYHRTTARSEKLAEAVGRPEESFMSGGADRDMRWFGTTLAALLMRVCDRSALDPADFADVPERLFGQPSLIGWVRANAELGRARDLEVAPDVLVDATRFLEAVTEAPTAGAASEPASPPIDSAPPAALTPSTTLSTVQAGPPSGRDGAGDDPTPEPPVSDTPPSAGADAINVTKVELETLIARVEALEEAFDAMVDDRD